MLLSLLACTWVPLADLEAKLACCDSGEDPGPIGTVDVADHADLGLVFVGASTAMVLDVTNSGEGPVSLGVTVASTTAEDWEAGLGAEDLLPGTSTTLEITFRPTVAGEKTAVLTLTGGVDTVTIDVEGTAQDDVDGDEHGSLASGGDDCDDNDSAVYPEAAETWYDGVDQDCDGASDFDQDADGYAVEDDCDDRDAAIHPGATEVWYDGVDQDCDDASDFDQDGDGYDRDDDCDDTDADAGGGIEDWNGRDDDCDGLYDEELDIATVASARLLGATSSEALGGDGALGLADLDEDGLADLVAASDTHGDEGIAYVVNASTLSGADGTIDGYAISLLTGSGSSPLGSVAPTTGDLVGDGTGDVVVGGGLGRSGTVWVLDGDRLGASITLDTGAEVTITGDSGWDYLHLAAVGDVDGDGVDDLVTAAAYDDYQEDTTRTDTGNVAWFQGPLAHDLDLGDADGQMHGAEEGESLGASLAVGDWNGDGYADAAAGAPGLGVDDTGGVALFAGGVTWEGLSDEAWVTVTGDVAGLQLGAEPLPGPGDLDGDGVDDLAILSAATGTSWLFVGLVDRAGAMSVVTADAAVTGDATALALGDLDADGFAEVIVGESGDDTNGADAGVFSVWRGPVGSGDLVDPEVSIVGEATGDGLGSGFAVGDTDGDGGMDLAVGASGVDGTGRGIGAVYVVKGR